MLRDLLRALRLFGDGRVTLGPLGWARIGGGPLDARCRSAPAGARTACWSSPPSRRTSCAPSATSSRGALPTATSSRGRCAASSWAASARTLIEALSDNLLALRALLEPEGPASGMLARPPRGSVRDPGAPPRADRARRSGDRARACGDRRHAPAAAAGRAAARRRDRRPPARAAARRDLRPPRPRPRRARRRAAARRPRQRRRRPPARRCEIEVVACAGAPARSEPELLGDHG